MGRAPDRRSGWWNSFYWRLSASLAAFVVFAILAESIVLIYWLENSGQGVPRRPYYRTALNAAADLSQTLDAGTVQDLDTFLRERFDADHPVYVLMRDGRTGSSSGAPLPDPLARAADLMLRGAPLPPGEELAFTGPVAFTPIQAGGTLRGFVIAVPTQSRGVFREIGRFVSVPTVMLLVIGATAGAFVLFRPARRRLAGLEEAAVRMGGGDLTSRAPESGRDEIGQLARAFNRMGDELATRDEALRTSDRLRRQLLADVSHELKTPLTAMRGYIETLQISAKGLDPGRRARYLQIVADETLRLDRLVGDLVDLARVENGIGSLDIRVFATRMVFAHVSRRHERAAEVRGVTITSDVTEAADQLVGDPHRIEQVVDNLVANALRYVPEGGRIELCATVLDDEARITVVDSGAGIPAEHVAHVFDRLYKADAARVSGATGSGLGLSIVKAIIELHGGRVDVTSRPGRTEFALTLPQSEVLNPAATSSRLSPGAEQSAFPSGTGPGSRSGIARP